MLSTDLILKGLGGVAVVGGTTGVGVWYLTKNKTEDLKSFAAKAGLSCTFTGDQFPSAGVNCIKLSTFAKNIKAKKEGSTEVEVSSLPADNSGKIKAYKTSTGEDHNKGFKFVIEENDISGNNTNKLEQFETYEIKQDGADWKLIRKDDSKKGIKKALGLDQISGCDLPSPTGCDVSGDKIKKIKFEGGNTGGEDGPNGAKLKISKVEGAGSSDYGPFGYKFVLESAGDANITSTVSIKANTNTEFKIKRATGSNSISLEKAWTAKSLGDKVGLTCPEDNDSNKECTLQDNKVNLKVDDTKKYTGLTKKANGDANDKKVKFALDQEGHNQGIKFTAENEICLQQNGGNGESSDEKKIENGSVTYQILKDSDGKWYLTKKNASQ